MKYSLIEQKGQYALILRGEHMSQYAVVNGLDQKRGCWDWTCSYFDFGAFSKMTRAEALSRALTDYFRLTKENYIPWKRMSEIATLLKDGLIEDDEEEAYLYMVNTVELSPAEAEYLGLEMEKYREAGGEISDDHKAPSSADGDYGPADPWNAPGMSVSDFV